MNPSTARPVRPAVPSAFDKLDPGPILCTDRLAEQHPRRTRADDCATCAYPQTADGWTGCPGCGALHAGYGCGEAPPFVEQLDAALAAAPVPAGDITQAWVQAGIITDLQRGATREHVWNATVTTPLAAFGPWALGWRWMIDVPNGAAKRTVTGLAATERGAYRRARRAYRAAEQAQAVAS